MTFNFKKQFPSLQALRTLTDDTGIFQHGIGGTPDPTHGYTTDDNARALLVTVRLWRRWPGHRAEIEPLMRRYTSFLRATQISSGPSAGRFVNFVGHDRRFLDEDGTLDCLGRCLWALAEAASGPLPVDIEVAIETMLARARAIYPSLRDSPRACAYALLGLARDPHFDPEILQALTAPLIAGWEQYGSDEWPWLEPYLTYDNARLLEASLLAANALEDNHLRSLANSAEEFLTQHSFRNNTLYPVGNQGWWPQAGTPAAFDQQPLEAAAYAGLYRLLRDPLLETSSIHWFLGRNSLGAPMVDVATGFCYDGLQENGPNANGGAESILAWLLAVT